MSSVEGQAHVEGTLTFFLDRSRARELPLAGVADLSLPSGAVVQILPRRAEPKLFHMLFEAIHRPSTAAVRVLVRKTERTGRAPEWDIALSPNDELTMSVADQYVGALGEEAFELFRCEECGEWTGIVNRRLLSSSQKTERDRFTAVLCLCDGPLCRRCGKNRIHRPISDYFDESDDSVWHVPYFAGLAPCWECRREGTDVDS